MNVSVLIDAFQKSKDEYKWMQMNIALVFNCNNRINAATSLYIYEDIVLLLCNSNY